MRCVMGSATGEVRVVSLREVVECLSLNDKGLTLNEEKRLEKPSKATVFLANVGTLIS